MRILEAQWKDYNEIIIFNVDQQNKVVCRPKFFLPQANGIAGFGGLNFYFFMLCELTVDCVIANYLHTGF